MGPLGATHLTPPPPPPVCTAGERQRASGLPHSKPKANLNSVVVTGGSGGDISCDGHTVMERRPVYHSLHPAVPLH